MARRGTHSRHALDAATGAAVALFLFAAAGARATEPPRYETVVTSPASPTVPEEDLAASASVVTGDRTPRSGESLPQLLSELPGVSLTRLGGLGSLATVSIRGSAANQVLVYLDGISLNSATWGAVDVGLVSLAGVERIEVYRGMSPIGFGASGIGGIVSLQSRVPKTSGARAHAGGGSFGTRMAGAEATWAGARIRLLASLDHVDSRGDFPFRHDNGTAFDPTDDTEPRRQNNRLAQTDALLRAVVPLVGRRELTASLALSSRDQGLPAFALFTSHEASLGTRRFLGSAAYDSREDLGPGGRLRISTYGSSGEQRLDDPRGEIGYVPTRTQDRTVALGATITANRPVNGWLRMGAVADVRHERFQPFDHLGNVQSGPPATRLLGAAGLEPHIHARAAALDVLPSLRVEAARDEVSGRDLFGRIAAETKPATYLSPIARLALVHRPAAWVTMRANGGRYARLPTTYERYGNTGRTLGNPDLRPETGVNADLGVTLAWGPATGSGATVDAAVFGSRVSDLIDWQQGSGRQRARNIDGARIAGAEAAFTGRWGSHLRAVAQGTFTDARDTSGLSPRHRRQLPNRPRWRGYARPELRHLPLAAGLRWGLYAEGDATSGNFLDPANLVAVPARWLFGAGAELAGASEAWRLVLSALNLGDARVNDLAGFPLPGRSVFLTLHLTHTSTKETDR